MVHLKSGTIARVDKYSNNVYVDLGKGSEYCKQYFCWPIGAKDKNGNKLNTLAKKCQCKYSLKGPPTAVVSGTNMQ